MSCPFCDNKCGDHYCNVTCNYVDYDTWYRLCSEGAYKYEYCPNYKRAEDKDR